MFFELRPPELPECYRNDTCHRIVVAVINHRRMVVYEGYSPLQAVIIENWCKDCGYDYRVIISDFAFERSE